MSDLGDVFELSSNLGKARLFLVAGYKMKPKKGFAHLVEMLCAEQFVSYNWSVVIFLTND